MKKIMMAAAIVCAAAMAQAAQIKWTSDYNYVTSAGVVQTATTADAGTFVLCYLGNGTADWSAATVVNEGTVSYGVVKGASNAKATGTYTWTYGDAGTPANGDIYAVMFKSAADGSLSQLQTVAGDPITTTYTVSGLSMNTFSGTYTFASSNYTTAVPEPTSGLLLLLGMAGLALKRKIA